MGTAARKARKRAGIPHVKPTKRPTRVYHQAEGLGLVSMAEILAGMVIRGAVERIRDQLPRGTGPMIRSASDWRPRPPRPNPFLRG